MKQIPGRPLEPQAPVQLEGRFPDCSTKHAVEVKRRQRRPARQCLQIERSVELGDYLLDRPLHGQRVER